MIGGTSVNQGGLCGRVVHVNENVLRLDVICKGDTCHHDRENLQLMYFAAYDFNGIGMRPYEKALTQFPKSSTNTARIPATIPEESSPSNDPSEKRA